MRKRKDVTYVADLANLELTDQERQRMVRAPWQMERLVAEYAKQFGAEPPTCPLRRLTSRELRRIHDKEE